MVTKTTTATLKTTHLSLVFEIDESTNGHLDRQVPLGKKITSPDVGRHVVISDYDTTDG